MNQSIALTLISCLGLVGCTSNGGTDREVPGTATSADGVVISFEVQGAGDTTLVFVHGWAGDRSYWAQQVDHFSDSYRVVAVDLAGHGASGVDRVDWRIDLFADDVIAVLDELALETVVLVGHSLGGPVVLEAALRSDRVIGVVGVDTFFDAWKTMTEETLSEFLAPLRDDFRQGTRDWVRSVMFTPTSDTAFVRRITDDMAQSPPELSIASMEGLTWWASDRFDVAVAELRIPLGVIQTEAAVPWLETVRRQGVNVPRLSIVSFSGTGHFLMMEAPSRFNDTLSALLSELGI
jgi:pimeloyl-ACP methyl ester carboxylesterase